MPADDATPGSRVIAKGEGLQENDPIARAVLVAPELYRRND